MSEQTAPQPPDRAGPDQSSTQTTGHQRQHHRHRGELRWPATASLRARHGLYTVRVVPSAFIAGYILVDPNDGVTLYDVRRESFIEHRDVQRGQ